ncbi:MAG: rhodanese-like domain-containing protein [Rhizobiaceae bacterium]|nr:rhodanese-like domain-containing protein [Rhizobiaceae bacterium]
MKSAKEYLQEANQVVKRIPGAEAVEFHGNEGSVFVDVRDTAAMAQTGTIAGAVHVPRGMLEFMADDGSPAHKAELKKDANIFLVCGAGGQAALAGKTLLDMGFENVTNIGGIGEWKEAGGPMAD